MTAILITAIVTSAAVSVTALCVFFNGGNSSSPFQQWLEHRRLCQNFKAKREDADRKYLTERAGE